MKTKTIGPKPLQPGVAAALLAGSTVKLIDILAPKGGGIRSTKPVNAAHHALARFYAKVLPSGEPKIPSTLEIIASAKSRHILAEMRKEWAEKGTHASTKVKRNVEHAFYVRECQLKGIVP